jgi:hypothetical protein
MKWLLLLTLVGCSTIDLDKRLAEQHQELLDQCDNYSGDSWCHYTEWEAIGAHQIKVEIGRWGECGARLGRKGASGLVGLATVESCEVVGQTWKSGCASWSLVCEEYKPPAESGPLLRAR